MKLPALMILSLWLVACNNENKPETSLVKSAGSEEKPVSVKKEINIPAVKAGIEGFYTGPFLAIEYDQNKDYYDNKITIIIDSVNEHTVFGHSVVAGNERPFQGRFEKKDSLYIVTAKEPGDNKYDGSFSFTIDTEKKTVDGTWESADKTLTVTKRKYLLHQGTYKYDPSLKLPEELVDFAINGTYKEDTEQYEGITEDALKKNASTDLLVTADVENMYKGDLEVMRNAIYARHGYSFKNVRMRTLFDSYVDWYMPVSTDVSHLLTEIEKKNIALLKRYEKHATKYYDSFGR